MIAIELIVDGWETLRSSVAGSRLNIGNICWEDGYAKRSGSLPHNHWIVGVNLNFSGQWRTTRNDKRCRYWFVLPSKMGIWTLFWWYITYQNGYHSGPCPDQTWWITFWAAGMPVFKLQTYEYIKYDTYIHTYIYIYV